MVFYYFTDLDAFIGSLLIYLNFKASLIILFIFYYSLNKSYS